MDASVVRLSDDRKLRHQADGISIKPGASHAMLVFTKENSIHLSLSRSIEKSVAALVFAVTASAVFAASNTALPALRDSATLNAFLAAQGEEIRVLRVEYDVTGALDRHRPAVVEGPLLHGFVLQHPDMHVGEPALTLGYRTKSGAWLVRGRPTRGSMATPTPVDPTRFDSFVAEVRRWQPAKRVTLPKVEGIDAGASALFEGYIGLISTVSSGTVHHVPLRGWELLGAPRADQSFDLSRLQLALARLHGEDIAKLRSDNAQFAQQSRVDAEHKLLWIAIRDDDGANFSRALASRKHLTLNSRQAYQLFFFAIENKRDNMAAELIKAGMPLLQDKAVHADFRQEFFGSQLSNFPERVAAAVLKVASLAGYKRYEELSAALNRAIEARNAQIQQQRQEIATLESMAPEIQNDPKFGFAASLSPEALQLAAKHRRFPPIEARNKNGETILFFALRDEKQCVQAPGLIRGGLDAHTANHLGVTPLMLAAGNCTNDMVALLIERNALVNAKSHDGSTALMYASVAGQRENVRLLLAAGAEVNVKTNQGETALGMARQQGFDDVVKILEQANVK